MKKLLFIIALFISFSSFGQTKTGIELCIQYQKAFNSFTSDKAADQALDKILNVIGASKNFTLIPCDDINNALAVTVKGDRFILFDGEFMRDINEATNNWSSLFILAHEVGHHINGHTRDFLLATVLDNQPLDERRIEELEADEFASFIVSKLGASYYQIGETINLISSNENDLHSTHPNYDKRIAAVKRGFNRASSDSESTKSNITTSKTNSAKGLGANDWIPNYSSPREAVEVSFGKWRVHKDYPLEHWPSLGNTKDPFEKKKRENSTPIVRLNSMTQGKPLSPYGSKGLILNITTDYWTNNYRVSLNGKKLEDYFADKTDKSISFWDWTDAPKEIDEEFATFEYVIDGKYSGEFVTKIGWYEYAGKKWPRSVDMGIWLDKLQRKQNYEFVERLKSGKKLYLRFGKLFVYNGWKQGPEGDVLDTSITSNKYKIPQYTYEFDLTGSSKALSY